MLSNREAAQKLVATWPPLTPHEVDVLRVLIGNDAKSIKGGDAS